MDKSKFNDKREWRKFGIALGIILGIIATILLFKAKSIYIYFYGGGAFFILAALAVPIIIKPVFILFLYIAHILGFIMTRVILSILFYLVITPIGWISRLFGKQFLDMKFNREKTSYWIETGKMGDEKENYENQF
jgi:hypothetical protein